jgi:hypothetical protein
VYPFNLPYRRNGNKRRRRRRRRRNNVRLPPIMRNQPVKFGPGSTIKYISQTLSLQTGFNNYNLLGSNMITSIEFTQSSLCFDYFKVESVKVIFRAFNFTNTDYTIRFRFKWGIEAMTEAEIMADDQVKIIGPVNLRPKVFTFTPPPIMCNKSGTDQKTVVMNDYQNVKDAVYPVSFGYSNGLSSVVAINVEWKVRFRGSSTYIPPSQLSKFLSAVKAQEKRKEEEEEKDEKEEEEEIGNEIKEENEIEKLRKEIEKLKSERFQ